MKHTLIIFLTLFLGVGCYETEVEDLAIGLLEDESIPLIVFSNPESGVYVQDEEHFVSIGISSIYDELSVNIQERISGYNLYINDVRTEVLPINRTRVFAVGAPGEMACFALSFRENGSEESRLSETFCINIP